MKKIGYLAFLALIMAFSTASVYADDVNAVVTKDSMITVGYDKSMGEKTIKAAVIDSYFRNICKNGNLIRWNKSTFPLKVYVEDATSVPTYYREVVMSAYQAWQRASEGLVRFEFVETANEADMKCYFKNTDNINTKIYFVFSLLFSTFAFGLIEYIENANPQTISFPSAGKDRRTKSLNSTLFLINI